MNELFPYQGHFFSITQHSVLSTQYSVLSTPRIHYLDEGSGDPVVMVHGNPTWSFYYRNLVRALRATHRTIVPDHVGCGRSDKPDDSQYAYTLANRVADLEALLDHLGVTKDITLIVHDWGGMIGMTYAVRHPERIRRIVVLNTGAFHLPQTKPFPWSLWFCRNPLIGPILVRGFNAFCLTAARDCVTRKPMSAEVRQGYLEPYDSWANRIAVLRFVQDIPLKPGDTSYDLVTATQDNLHKLRDKPMLICWGDRDWVFDRHFLAEWQTRFPQAEVHRFADAGHYVLEDAADEIVPLVQRFLSEPEA